MPLVAAVEAATIQKLWPELSIPALDRMLLNVQVNCSWSEVNDH